MIRFSFFQIRFRFLWHDSGRSLKLKNMNKMYNVENQKVELVRYFKNTCKSQISQKNVPNQF